MRLYIDDHPHAHDALIPEYKRYLKKGGTPCPYRGCRFGQWLFTNGKKKEMLADLYQNWWLPHPELWEYNYEPAYQDVLL